MRNDNKPWKRQGYNVGKVVETPKLQKKSEIKKEPKVTSKKQLGKK